MGSKVAKQLLGISGVFLGIKPQKFPSTEKSQIWEENPNCGNGHLYKNSQVLENPRSGVKSPTMSTVVVSRARVKSQLLHDPLGFSDAVPCISRSGVTKYRYAKCQYSTVRRKKWQRSGKQFLLQCVEVHEQFCV